MEVQEDRPRARRSKRRGDDCSGGRLLISDEFGEIEVDTYARPLLFAASSSPPPPPPPLSPVQTLLQSVREAEPRMTEEEMLLLALQIRSRRGSLASLSHADLVRLIRTESRRKSAECILHVYNKFATSTSAASDGDECAICLESLTKLEVQTLDCGHAFHVKCITSWYEEKYECPCCRRHVKLAQDFPPLT